MSDRPRFTPREIDVAHHARRTLQAADRIERSVRPGPDDSAPCPAARLSVKFGLPNIFGSEAQICCAVVYLPILEIADFPHPG